MAVEILEVSFRGVDNDPATEALIQRHVTRLQKFATPTAIRVAVEQPNGTPSFGSRWRIRIECSVPPQHNIVVRREPQDGDMHEQLKTAVKDAFHTMERQLRKIHQEQSGIVKAHPAQELVGVVDRVLEGYGFIRDVEGREIYFHENALLYSAIEDVGPGTGVTFEAEMGDDGLQATTVRVVDARHADHDIDIEDGEQLPRSDVRA